MMLQEGNASQKMPGIFSVPVPGMGMDIDIIVLGIVLGIVAVGIWVGWNAWRARLMPGQANKE